MRENGLKVVEDYDFKKQQSTTYDSTDFFKKLSRFAEVNYEGLTSDE